MADIPGGGSRLGEPQLTRRLEGKGLEARTKAVEEVLGPLIMEVSRSQTSQPSRINIYISSLYFAVKNELT